MVELITMDFTAVRNGPVRLQRTLIVIQGICLRKPSRPKANRFQPHDTDHRLWPPGCNLRKGSVLRQLPIHHYLMESPQGRSCNPRLRLARRGAAPGIGLALSSRPDFPGRSHGPNPASANAPGPNPRIAPWPVPPPATVRA